ncbi:MAG: type II toxin-antitoxin system HicA family toxin [Pirellulales bacterium]|nr:type II toxin-antitoxin system HicA family toxin [Pirellulales bacterium]
MGSLRRIPACELIAILEADGFSEVRRRGSHIALQRVDQVCGTITVIVPDHKEIRVGTLQSISRQSRLPRKLFAS